MPKSKNLKWDILSTFKTLWLNLKFVHNVEWGQTVLPDRYLPKMMTRSSTVVMIATAKNILKRSAPICWIFSSSWLVTTVEGMTKPNATPSCQNRFWMHYFLIFLTLHTYCLKITQKCLIFQISTIFVLLKVACLITLPRPKWT